LLNRPIEDNKALMTASYLLVRANYETIEAVDSLIFAKWSSVISGCLDFRLLHGIIIWVVVFAGPSSFKVVRIPYSLFQGIKWQLEALLAASYLLTASALYILQTHLHVC